MRRKFKMKFFAVAWLSLFFASFSYALENEVYFPTFKEFQSLGQNDREGIVQEIQKFLVSTERSLVRSGAGFEIADYKSSFIDSLLFERAVAQSLTCSEITDQQKATLTDIERATLDEGKTCKNGLACLFAGNSACITYFKTTKDGRSRALCAPPKELICSEGGVSNGIYCNPNIFSKNGKKICVNRGNDSTASCLSSSDDPSVQVHNLVWGRLGEQNYGQEIEKISSYCRCKKALNTSDCEMINRYMRRVKEKIPIQDSSIAICSLTTESNIKASREHYDIKFYPEGRYVALIRKDIQPQRKSIVKLNPEQIQSIVKDKSLSLTFETQSNSNLHETISLDLTKTFGGQEICGTLTKTSKFLKDPNVDNICESPVFDVQGTNLYEIFKNPDKLKMRQICENGSSSVEFLTSGGQPLAKTEKFSSQVSRVTSKNQVTYQLQFANKKGQDVSVTVPLNCRSKTETGKCTFAVTQIMKNIGATTNPKTDQVIQILKNGKKD